ncbi:MAG: CoA transferase, partial [Dongiaceae bacterium]
LRERDHTGKGAFVDVAMHDVALALQTFEMANFFVGDTIPRPHGNTTSTNAGYSAYETRDGPIMIGAYTPELQRRLWQVLGEKDRAIAPTLYDVGERSGEDARDLAAHLARRSSAELEAALQAAGVPAARIRTLDAALDDATGARRPVVVAAPADTTDTAAMPRFPGLPFKLDDAGFGLRHAPRRHGADTRAVLMELGYSNDEIDRLAATGAIRCA